MCPPTILDYDSYLSLTAESYMWCEYLSRQQTWNLFLHFSLVVTYPSVMRKSVAQEHMNVCFWYANNSGARLLHHTMTTDRRRCAVWGNAFTQKYVMCLVELLSDYPPRSDFYGFKERTLLKWNNPKIYMYMCIAVYPCVCIYIRCNITYLSCVLVY